MRDNFKISVIVPVYNCDKFLDTTINSIVNQTYKNLEIILVDDGSFDSSPLICDNWAEKDRRIKVIHKSNGGASSARNAGLDCATGDYIAFVDGDDYIDHDMYEIMLGHIVQYDADAAACGMVRENKNAPDEEWGSADAEIEIADNTELLRKVGQASGILPIHVGNKLFSKSVVNNVRFDTRFKYSEDVLFNYFAAKNISKMVIQNVARYHYVSNEDSVSHKKFNAQRFDEHRVMDIIIDDAKDNKEIIDYCIQGDVLKSFRTVKRMMASGNETDKFNDMRNRILSYKRTVFNNSNFSNATRFKVLFIWLFPNIYKKFITCYGKKHFG